MGPVTVGEQRRSDLPLPREFYDENDSDNVCFLCGKPKYVLSCEVSHFGFPFRFQRCECGLEKQTPMPNEKFFEWFFNSDVFFSSKRTKTEKIWGYYDYFKDEPCRLATSRWRYKRLREISGSQKPLTVMKIGPSTGTMLYIAKQEGHSVRGCDVSSTFVQYAKENYAVEIDNGRFERMGYADEQFDLVFLLNVLENVPNPEELLIEIHRTLRPGGYFVLNFVEMRGNMIAKFQKSRYFLYRPPVCYIYTDPVLVKVLRKYGFRVERRFRDIRYMHTEKILTLLDWSLPLRVSRAIRFERFMFPIWAYPSWMVVALKQ